MKSIVFLLSVFCLLALSSTCMDYGALLVGMDFDNHSHVTYGPTQCYSLSECLNMICKINSFTNVSYVVIQPYGP